MQGGGAEGVEAFKRGIEGPDVAVREGDVEPLEGLVEEQRHVDGPVGELHLLEVAQRIGAVVTAGSVRVVCVTVNVLVSRSRPIV